MSEHPVDAVAAALSDDQSFRLRHNTAFLLRHPDLWFDGVWEER